MKATIQKKYKDNYEQKYKKSIKLKYPRQCTRFLQFIREKKLSSRFEDCAGKWREKKQNKIEQNRIKQNRIK